jgi:hypothetical protein
VIIIATIAPYLKLISGGIKDARIMALGVPGCHIEECTSPVNGQTMR